MILRNKSAHDFVLINSEEWREYHYPDGKNIIIKDPAYLSVSPSGNHRILDLAGISYFIPQDWRHITWKARKGKPHFVK